MWTVVGVAALYLSLNALSISQQWQLSLPGNPFRDDKFTPHGVTLLAIPLAGGLLGVTATLTALHAKRSHGRSWLARLPQFSGLNFDVVTVEGRSGRVVSLIVLLLVPAAAQVHFALKFFAGRFYLGEKPRWSGIEHLTHYVSVSDALFGQYFYDRRDAIAPGFVPFWEPWLFVLSEMAVLAVVAWSLAEIFSKTTAPTGVAMGRPARAKKRTKRQN
jgi:hypothetical protein